MFCTLRGICVICLSGACKRLPQLCSSETDSGSKERSCNLELKAEQLSSSVKVEVPAGRASLTLCVCARGCVGFFFLCVWGFFLRQAEGVFLSFDMQYILCIAGMSKSFYIVGHIQPDHMINV